MLGMPSCREVTQMVSESMDRPLSIRTRIWMWMHLIMCRYCKRFRRQMLGLRIASRLTPADDAAPLAEAARQRIKAALESEKDAIGHSDR